MKAFFLILSLLLAAPAALAVDVEGYVYTADGTPVAKAAVNAGSQRAITDAEGYFKVTAPADSILKLEVKAENLPSATVLALAGDPPLTVTLAEVPNEGVMRTTATAMPAAMRAPRPPGAASARDRAITGVVRIGKRPLANAPVTIHAIAEVYSPPVNVTTDEKGRYRTAVAPGRYFIGIGEGLGPRLRPANERMYGGEDQASIADVTKNEEAAVDIELVAAPLITGRVVDADDKPVGRADVLIALAGRSALEFFHQPIVRTLPNGRFAVPAPAFPDTETAEIVATPTGHSPTRSKPFVLRQPKEAVITLPKFDDVTVRVTDRQGKPLNDATVAYALSEETTAFGGDAGVLLMPHVARRRVRATNGEVVLRLTAGEYEFAASAPKYQPKSESRTINRPIGFAIALEPGFAVRGRVRRGDKPVAGVHITIRGGNVGRAERALQTDEKGEFTFESLARGTYNLAFFKSEELVDRMMTVDAPANIDLSLPPTGTLTGRVIDAKSGAPVAEFLYTLETTDTANEQSRMRGRPIQQRGAAGSDGSFSTTVPIGTYRIIAAAAGYLPSEAIEVRVTEREPATVEIPLGRGATVTGRVTDEAGKPLLEANVVIAQDVGEISRSARSMTRVSPTAATTGDDGTFTITGVEPGPAQLIVRRSGYAPERRPIDVEAETRVDIVLTRGLSVTGIVTIAGKPAAGVSVDATTSAVNADHQSTMTDERGRFTLEGLIAARYTINANFEQHHAQLDNVDVAQRREVTIELEGKGRGVIVGTVTGMPRVGGKMLRGTVYAQSSQIGAEGTIDPAGNYRIENAPAGSVDVVAHVETQQGTRSTTKKRLELAAGQTLRVDLDLTPSLLVSGRVTHGSSKAVARAHIVFNNESAGMVSAITREDGSYEVGLPAPGTYQIFANAEELVSRHYQTIREIRGSETFDIHLAEQTVEGLVLDAATSQPLANALVTLVPRQTMQTQMQTVSSETITDASGRFTMTTAANGPHLLIASAHGYAHRSQDVSLGGGAPIRAQFELAGASELRVRVVDAKTKTPLEAHLVLGSDKGHYLPVRATRSPDGAEFVFSLAPGRYVLTAISMSYPERKVEVTAPGTVTVQME